MPLKTNPRRKAQIKQGETTSKQKTFASKAQKERLEQKKLSFSLSLHGDLSSLI